MSFADLQASVARDPAPPVDWSGALAGLWHDAKGDWHAAHTAAQEDRSREGSWVHAYLHRKEGDRANAGYWYAKAGRPMPAENIAFALEWEQLARALAERADGK
ncbi:MAG: hypothetical protein B9S34_11875 [Opitutia bacterium Tous-C1TDCM]|nr:MAG: hypothetical protein B9S34_11875 [Opitutae bacterium Tous-C1TDCM]